MRGRGRWRVGRVDTGQWAVQGVVIDPPHALIALQTARIVQGEGRDACPCQSPAAVPPCTLQQCPLFPSQSINCLRERVVGGWEVSDWNGLFVVLQDAQTETG